MAMAMEPRPPAQAEEARAMEPRPPAPAAEVRAMAMAMEPRPPAQAEEAREKAMEQAEMTRTEANKSAHSGYCRRNAG